MNISIIKQYHKDTGITYVYESESYWDKEKKQPRSRRKLIGKLDDETGEIIPTGRKNRNQKERSGPEPTPSTETAGNTAMLRQDLREMEKEIDRLKARSRALEAENKVLRDTLETIRELIKTV